MCCTEKKGSECNKQVRVVQKHADLNTLLYLHREQLSVTSRTAAALVRCSFADAALGTLGTAHGAAGTAGAAAWGEQGEMRGQR